ncbi:hypothetical protein PLCT1_02346 [Planctomycetaceae bacterium]|nr:hypothetical protein PLCT1_02346 [Planctomycetaceae bacterium]
MEVRFLTSGESPDFGPFKEGEIRIFPEAVGKILIGRGLVAETKTKAAVKADKEA